MRSVSLIDLARRFGAVDDSMEADMACSRLSPFTIRFTLNSYTQTRDCDYAKTKFSPNVDLG